MIDLGTMCLGELGRFAGVRGEYVDDLCGLSRGVGGE